MVVRILLIIVMVCTEAGCITMTKEQASFIQENNRQLIEAGTPRMAPPRMTNCRTYMVGNQTYTDCM